MVDVMFKPGAWKAGSHWAQWTFPLFDKPSVLCQSCDCYTPRAANPHCLCFSKQVAALTWGGGLIGSICHWMTSNAAAFYFHGATKDPQLRPLLPPSLTAAKSLNYMIKGCHRESMKATWWNQFPSGCWVWLPLYKQLVLCVNEEVCFCLSVTQVRYYTPIKPVTIRPVWGLQ